MSGAKSATPSTEWQPLGVKAGPIHTGISQEQVVSAFAAFTIELDQATYPRVVS
jgi:hypothetical protein